MNVAIAKAMLREQFLRTWPIVVFCLGLCALLFLIQYADNVYNGSAAAPVDLEFQRLTIVLVHAIGIIALLYCHSDERNLTMTMPSYLLRLPVRTSELVIYRMSYNLFCVAVVAIGCSTLCRLVFGPSNSTFEFYSPFRIGITTFAVLQALAWSIGAKGIFRLLVACVVCVFVAGSLDMDAPRYLRANLSLSVASVISLVLAASTIVAYVGVRMRRSEAIRFDGMLRSTLSVFGRERRIERPPFNSPDEAMRWFEWRRQSRLLPWLVCGVTIFVLATTVNFMRMHEQYLGNEIALVSSQISVGVCCTTLIPTTLVFGAYCCFQNQRLQLGPLQTFFYARPVTTKSIAVARIIVALRSVVLSMIPLLLSCTVAVVLALRDGDTTLPSRLPAFVANHMGLRGAGIALLLFWGMFAIAWCVQWFGNLLGPLLVLGTLSTVLLSVDGSNYGAVNEHVLFVVAGFVLFTATAAAGYLAFQRDLIDRRGVYVSLAVWPLLAVGFSTFIHFDQFIYDGQMSYEPMLQHASVVFAFAAMPVAPLVTVPLFMHLTRHR